MSDVKIIAGIEGDAVQQLKKTAELPAVGMPDLHPGRGTPVGAAFVSKGRFYPHSSATTSAAARAFGKRTSRSAKRSATRWYRVLKGSIYRGTETHRAGSPAIRSRLRARIVRLAPLAAAIILPNFRASNA